MPSGTLSGISAAATTTGPKRCWAAICPGSTRTPPATIPLLIDAACLYAEAVRTERDTRLRWAAYAFDASSRLYDTYHPRTLAAARILVELAQRLDLPGP